MKGSLASEPVVVLLPPGGEALAPVWRPYNNLRTVGTMTRRAWDYTVVQ